MKNRMVVMTMMMTLVALVAYAASGPRGSLLGKREFSVENLSQEERTYFNSLDEKGQEAYRKGYVFRRSLMGGRKGKGGATRQAKRGFSVDRLPQDQQSYYNGLSEDCQKAYKSGFDVRRQMRKTKRK